MLTDEPGAVIIRVKVRSTTAVPVALGGRGGKCQTFQRCHPVFSVLYPSTPRSGLVYWLEGQSWTNTPQGSVTCQCSLLTLRRNQPVLWLVTNSVAQSTGYYGGWSVASIKPIGTMGGKVYRHCGRLVSC